MPTWWSRSFRTDASIPDLYDLQSAWSRTLLLVWICTILILNKQILAAPQNRKLGSRWPSSWYVRGVDTFPLEFITSYHKDESFGRAWAPSTELNESLLFEHFFQFFRQGGNAWNLFDFDNQSAAFSCGDTMKYLFHSNRSKRFRGS